MYLLCTLRLRSVKRKAINLPFNKINQHHKLMQQQIGVLYKLKGENVILEDINRFGIILQKPFEMKKKS